MEEREYILIIYTILQMNPQYWQNMNLEIYFIIMYLSAGPANEAALDICSLSLWEKN